jgi:hypothetical protein
MPSRNVYFDDETYAALLDAAIKRKKQLNEIIKEAIQCYLQSLKSKSA